MPDTYWDLFAGYTVIWLIIAFFVFRLVRSQSELQKKIEKLQSE